MQLYKQRAFKTSNVVTDSSLKRASFESTPKVFDVNFDHYAFISILDELELDKH